MAGKSKMLFSIVRFNEPLTLKAGETVDMEFDEDGYVSDIIAVKESGVIRVAFFEEIIRIE